MVGVREAAVRAGHLAQEGMELSQWAGLMGQLDSVLASRDQAVGRAAALGRFLMGEERGVAPFTVELDAERAGVPSSGDHRVARLAVLQATRAASRQADPVQQLLLAGVERELLEAAPGQDAVEQALRGWVRAVSHVAHAPTPEDALAISMMQLALTRRGTELLATHEVIDGVGHGRLTDAVEASEVAWEQATRAWFEMVPGRPDPASPLGRAMVTVHLAMREGEPHAALTALMRTGFGGNLVSAVAVTPAELRQESRLVQAAMVLEPRSDVATTFRPVAREPEPVAGPPAGDPVVIEPTVQPSPAQLRETPAAREFAEDLPEVELGDRAGLTDLARVRDAGVVAASVLKGVLEARDVVPADVTVPELEALVTRGGRAQSLIVEAGIPLVRHWGKRLYPQLRDDYRQNAAVALIEAAQRWDPEKASWSTYAYRSARFALMNELRAVGGRSEFASELLDLMRIPQVSRISGAVPSSPEDVVMARAERQELAEMLGQIPADLREAVTTRMGFHGAPATLEKLADRVDSSISTVARRVRLAVDELRRLPAPVEEQRSEAPDLRQLALALRHDRGSRPQTCPRPQIRSESGGVVTP